MYSHSGFYSSERGECHYAECRYAECRYAECCGAHHDPKLNDTQHISLTTLSILDLILTLRINDNQCSNSISIQYHAECRNSGSLFYCYADCHCAKCRSAKCRGTLVSATGFVPTNL